MTPINIVVALGIVGRMLTPRAHCCSADSAPGELLSDIQGNEATLARDADSSCEIIRVKMCTYARFHVCIRTHMSQDTRFNYSQPCMYHCACLGNLCFCSWQECEYGHAHGSMDKHKHETEAFTRASTSMKLRRLIGQAQA